MGWERKRGKIEEFNRLLRGADGHQLLDPGRRAGRAAVGALLHHARLGHAAAARRRQALIGIIAHPLNRPRFDARARARHRGLRHPAAARQRHDGQRRGIAVRAHLRRPHRRRSRTRPRSPTSTRICSAKASSPARASTTSTPSPRRSTDACPENALLSHDLFEGLYARTGAGHRRRGRGRLSLERARARAAAAPLGARRLADPVVAVSAACPRAPASRAIACRSSRAGRSSTTSGAAWCRRRRCCCWSPGGRAAGPSRSRGRRWRWRRSRSRSAVGRIELLRGPAARPGVARCSCARSADDLQDRRGALRAAADVPRQRGLRAAARDRASRWCGSASPAAACSSGKRRRRAPRAAARSSRARS